MADWRTRPLGEVFDVQLGKMLGAGSKHGDQFQYLANRNVQWGRIVIDELGTMNFSATERQRYRLQSGDLLVCEGGEVGRAALWSDELPECYFQNALHRLRATSDANPRFMRHYFEFAAMAGSFRALTGQTSIGHLPRANLVRWPVPIPPLEEQRRIAEILDTIDETIQATERVIAKLDTISSALGEASLSGVSTEDLVRLGDGCRVLGGKRLPAGHTYSPTQTPYRYLRVVDFYRRNVDYESLAALSESTFQGLSRYEIRSGELFISIAGSIGHVGVNQPPTGMRTILTENAARVVPSDSFVPSYLAIQMNAPHVRAQVRAEIGTGGGVPKLALHRVANLRVSCPDISVQKEVARRYEVGWATRQAETRRLDKLRELRTGLAADLLSGRVRTVAV